MSHRDGWVWVLTATDGTGTRFRLYQRWTRLEYRKRVPWFLKRLRRRPALYHDFEHKHMLRHEAELYPWGPLKGESSLSPPTAHANNVAAPRLAGLLRLVRRYRQMGGTLWQPIFILLLTLAFAFLGMVAVCLYLYWIPAGR